MKQSERIKILEQNVRELTGRLDRKEALNLSKPTKEEYEKLKEPKFETGKWYVDFTDSLFFAKSINTECFVGDFNGYYVNGSIGIWNITSQIKREATNSEIETALIQEAERRGFKDGVKYLSVEGKYPMQIESPTWSFWVRENGNNCFSYTEFANCIFYNGKWAEIIEDTLTINGQEMKVDGDIISFGCAKFHKRQFDGLLARLDSFNQYNESSNRKIVSIKLDSGVELTIEDLNKVVNKLN